MACVKFCLQSAIHQVFLLVYLNGQLPYRLDRFTSYTHHLAFGRRLDQGRLTIMMGMYRRQVAVFR